MLLETDLLEHVESIAHKIIWLQALASLLACFQ